MFCFESYIDNRKALRTLAILDDLSTQLKADVAANILLTTFGVV